MASDTTFWTCTTEGYVGDDIGCTHLDTMVCFIACHEILSGVQTTINYYASTCDVIDRENAEIRHTTTDHGKAVSALASGYNYSKNKTVTFCGVYRDGPAGGTCAMTEMTAST